MKSSTFEPGPSDDNLLLKSRLLYLEKRVANLIVNDFENNGPAAVRVIGTPNGSCEHC